MCIDVSSSAWLTYQRAQPCRKWISHLLVAINCLSIALQSGAGASQAPPPPCWVVYWLDLLKVLCCQSLGTAGLWCLQVFLGLWLLQSFHSLSRHGLETWEQRVWYRNPIYRLAFHRHRLSSFRPVVYLCINCYPLWKEACSHPKYKDKNLGSSLILCLCTKK